MEIIKIRFLQISGIVVGGLTTLALFAKSSVPSYVYPISFGVFMFVYNKWIWKLITPRVNFDGDWWGFTEYQILERKFGNDEPKLPNKKPHIVSFYQSPFELRIEPSEGKDMIIWKADAIAIYSEGKVVMAYSVKRESSDKGFPLETKGYEEMHVVDRNWFGIPTKLKGVFFHVAEPDKNLFRGETEYYRGKPPKNMEMEIRKNENN